TGPPPPGAGGDVLDRLNDVCFELFRYSEGSFEFEADRRPSWPAERAVDVSGLLAETDRRMAEWREIIAVIPSVEARPRLVPEPPGANSGTSGPITLDAGQFTVCKVLRSLVQAGLVEIDAADQASAPAEPDRQAPSRPVKGERNQGPGRPEPEPLDVAPVVDAEPDPLADGLDRGAVVALLANARSK